MFSPKRALCRDFRDHLVGTFLSICGEESRPWAERLGAEAEHAIGFLQRASTLYHDAEHTMLVTLVGQEILIGRSRVGPVAPSDWLHLLLALLLHDIGFAGGACRGDRGRVRVVDADGTLYEMPPGGSDALMIPHHVNRGALHAQERYCGDSMIEAARLAVGIRGTLFPAPTGEQAVDPASEPGIVRAADLIGQLSDPAYQLKTPALFWELYECGIAAEAGYASPADMVASFPAFFRRSVAPHLGPALADLERTEDGRAAIARLYAHLDAAAGAGQGADWPSPGCGLA